jgi:hypothetical protein
MTFDLRSLAHRVGHATLTLRCLDPSPDGGTVYVVDDSSWVEGNRCNKPGTGLTFADVDCTADGTIDATDQGCSSLAPNFALPWAQLGPVRAGKDVSVDLTEVFKTRIPDLHTFVIASTDSNGARFASREQKASIRPELAIEELVNDECDAPTVVKKVPFVDEIDTRNAGTSDGDPAQSCVFPSTGTNTVWYSYTPTKNGTVTVSTAGSSYATLVGAYTGTCNPIDNALTEVGCQGDPNAKLSFPAVKGTPYLILVSDYSGSFNPGGGTLRVKIDLR